MQSLYSGLVAYWNLQDASGSRLDLTGNGSALTNTGTVTSADGIIGAASSFVRASSQRLSASSSSVLQGGAKDYTFAAWIYLTSTSAANYVIVGKTTAASGAGQREYQLEWFGTTSLFRFLVYTATDTQQALTASTFGAASLNTWYFIRAWYDNTAQTSNIEINGGTIDTLSIGASAQAASTASFVLGDNLTSGGNGWDGKICEVGKWDRVLTKQESLWLYNKGRGRTYPFTGRYSIELLRHGRSRRKQGIA